MDNSLPESERLKGKTAVSALMSEGRWGFAHGLKYCFLVRETGAGRNRIMVSVPKRLFKRAVKRNLLKRRLREAYRTQKHILQPLSCDLLLLYNTQEIMNFSAIREQVEVILNRIADEGQL